MPGRLSIARLMQRIATVALAIGAMKALVHMDNDVATCIVPMGLVLSGAIIGLLRTRRQRRSWFWFWGGFAAVDAILVVTLLLGAYDLDSFLNQTWYALYLAVELQIEDWFGVITWGNSRIDRTRTFVLIQVVLAGVGGVVALLMYRAMARPPVKVPPVAPRSQNHEIARAMP